MEISIAWIVKLFGFANAVAFGFLLLLAIKPLLGFGTFAVTIKDWRYGYGSGGWTVQHTKTNEVSLHGFYPWYTWWFDRWYEKNHGPRS